jgi:hypothetical protein
MKPKKLLKKLIQAPLKFHHQDLHEEFQIVKNTLDKLDKKITELLNRLGE